MICQCNAGVLFALHQVQHAGGQAGLRPQIHRQRGHAGREAAKCGQADGAERGGVHPPDTVDRGRRLMARLLGPHSAERLLGPAGEGVARRLEPGDEGRQRLAGRQPERRATLRIIGVNHGVDDRFAQRGCRQRPPVGASDFADHRFTRQILTDEGDGFLDGLHWLGLSWDEGPEVAGEAARGPYAPYRQMERLPSYAAAAERLLAADQAYPCYCTAEELAVDRAAQEAASIAAKAATSTLSKRCVTSVMG